MSFVLICSMNGTCRRLHVDNLVLRGYVAVGTASIEEASILLQRELPFLILLCCIGEDQEARIAALRQIAVLDDVPVIMVSPEQPESDWMNEWGIVQYIHYPVDFRKLVQLIRPWLTQKPAVLMPLKVDSPIDVTLRR